MEVAESFAFGVAVILMVVGVLGTVVPILPGLPLIWLAMLGFAIMEKFQRIDASFLGITLLVLIAAEVIDHLARAWGAKRFGAGKYGVWGAVIGSLIGLFFLPLGLILGPFLGALIGELLAGRSASESIRAGWGGLVGTLGSIVIKIAVAIGMTVAFVAKVF